VVAAELLLSVFIVLGFVLACLALWLVRPTWLRMRASVGRWVSFSVEMDGRREAHLATRRITSPGHVDPKVRWLARTPPRGPTRTP
jgi:hypothetical protein